MRNTVIALLLLTSAAYAQFNQPSASGAPQPPYSIVSAVYSTPSTGSSPCIDLRGQNVAWHHVSITASLGAVSALTFSVDTSPDCSNWTTGGAIASNSSQIPPMSITGTVGTLANFVRINVSSITGGGQVNFRYDGYPAAIDPCGSPWTVKQTKGLNNVTAAAIAIANTSGAVTYVCFGALSNSGTTPTLSMSSGTGSACGTNGVPVMGTISLSSGIPFSINPGGMTFASSGPSPSRDICITPGGTSPSVSGSLTYVVQAGS